MHAAFYKAIRPGLGALYSHAVRIVDHGPYSHCELVFSDGVSASASWVDGGTREKRIAYRRGHWDALALPDHLEPRARQWVRDHMGLPYDLAGNLRFVLPIVPQDPCAWFCSEFLGGALAWHEPERYGPNGAAALIRTMYPQPAESGFFFAL
ncbi:hypothetical protein [Acidovorax sp.]|uniref:hypothetical protein n=1 Tax=Acidovorax sp. TaxID=1872122 RepID=UPI00391FA9B3